MKAVFAVSYHPDVPRKDMPKIGDPVRARIRKAIEAKLFSAPEEFGDPLRRTLKGYWKLRVGDYRIIYKVTGRTVLIFRIGHRSEVYLSGLRG